MTKEKIFRNIASKTSGKDCSHLPGCCPDQYVGLIKDFKEEDKKTKELKVKKDFPFREDIFTPDTSACVNISDAENILILILESPHTDEFYAEDVKDENGTVIHHKDDPIGPANGPTGRNIREHILDILGNGYKSYHLILMNAIPFQCSLGFSLSKKEKENLKRRDEVFSAIWDNDDIGKVFFKKRFQNLLKELKNKRVIIVNACTAGYKKEKVQMVIDAEFGIIQLAHPSVNWNSKTKTEREKVESAGLYIEK